MNRTTINDKLDQLDEEFEKEREYREYEEKNIQTRDIFGKFLGIFNKKTGEGPVEKYLEHPLNFAQSKGWAQILRGLTGLLGDLNRAIVDIVIGIAREIYEKIKPRQPKQ